MTALYIARTYDEACDLLVEARGFAAREYHKKRKSSGSGRDRLMCNRESFRLTSRLTQVMAWLLAQKAYQAGELSREDIAKDAFRLDGEGVCMDCSAAHDAELPRQLTSLLGRSYALYCRVRRMDRQFASDLMKKGAVGRPRKSKLELDSGFEAETLEFLVELGKLTAGIDQAVHTGPCRMRARVDIELEGITLIAVGRIGLVACPIGQLDRYLVIIGMSICFHLTTPKVRRGCIAEVRRGCKPSGHCVAS